MKKPITIILLLITSFVFISCNEASPIDNDLCYLSNTEGVYLCEKTATSYFDTTISLKLYYQETDTYDVNEVFNYFEETLSTYHKYFDKYNAYQDINNVYTINNSDGEVIIDSILYDAIKYGIDNSDLVVLDETNLFNIALNPVVEVWHNARESVSCDTTIETGISYCPLPTEEIDGVTFNTDINDIVLNQETSSISFLKEDMSIDLGGYAKGYVANVLTEHLNQLDITYILNLGNSNVIANGTNPTNDYGEFIIALIEPSVNFTLVNNYYQYVKIPEDMAIVTSGNYQRFFKDIDTGDVYHHIIDPRTNYPGGDTMSVSIIYNDSALADILSTSIYLMDLESALEYVNNTDGLEAVWYGYDGEITYSENFENYVYILD